MIKKSQNQHVSVKKTFKLWSPITNGSVTIAHSTTAQVGGWRVGDETRERMRHNEWIFFNEA
jgi:hypothetical protein